MIESHVITELVVVLGAAAVVTVVFQAVRLPVVLGYVVAGIVIGPHVPVPLVADPQLVHELSELGVILLMFTIGLELPLATIARVGLPGAATAVFEVGLVVTVGTLVARLVGFGSVESVFAGALLGLSSTMIVAKTFEERGWKGGFTEVVYAILVFEDLIAILLFALVAAVASGAGLDARALVTLLATLGGFLVLMLVGGLLVVPRAIRWIGTRARRETLVISALLVCFGFAALAAAAGYSVALGAFIAGVLIAESGHGPTVQSLVAVLRDVFAMVFFVSIGMSIDPAVLAGEVPRILELSAVVLVFKPIGVAIGVFLAGNGWRPGVRAGLSLAQIGEMSFVIASISRSPALLAVAVGVSCVTLLVSPILIPRSEQIAHWAAHHLPGRLATFVTFYDAWVARLRTRERSTWGAYRRTALILVVDTTLVIAIVIASATLGIPLLALAALPLAVVLIRQGMLLARRLAAEIIPSGGPVDLGRAARRALVATFEVAIALVIVVVIVATVQPFVPGSFVLLLLAALGLGVVIRRSTADFAGHVRAGSELILELLTRSQPDAPAEPKIETFLPGFEGTATLTIPAGAVAAGKSLAELDLRARTGASVLAIARGAHGMVAPSPSEPLQAGDVLALAGSDEAIAAARAMLGPP